MTVPTPYLYNATVVDVHDGDTFSVVIDRGFFDYLGSTAHPIPVRILGINARELTQDGGPEARDNLAALLPVGSPVVLATAKPDKYAPRWDAAVQTPTIPDLATALIATGWAAAYDGTGTKPVPPWPRATT
jgi:endonuclease YncB( thermonuclease family)